MAGSKRATLDQILDLLSRDTLKEICTELDLSTTAREKRLLVDRILEATGAERKPDPTRDAAGGASPAVPPLVAPAPPPLKAPKTQTWLAFPSLGPTPESAAPPPAPAMRSLAGDDWTLTLEVERRKPRLAWQTMWRKESAVPVPTQVVEIVHPGRAIRRDDELIAEARQQVNRDATMVPPNRLIWTNDNLVALTTLLEERDPATRDYRYRGKVDLIYIDPPFMVNSDFRVDNTVELDIDAPGGVATKKEPSLVEILAYKDTWRDGLDTFLSMLKQRITLLKELLAPAGSIYVHLDWHTAHYVKVLLDEEFGYEKFQNEIVWKRTSARGDSRGFNLIHDVLLVYGQSADPYWCPQFGPFSAEYIKSHYSSIDPETGRRFTLVTMRSPNPRPNLMYEWKGYKPHVNGWAYSRETMAELDQAGLIYYPERGGQLRLKRFLEEEGAPLSTLWTDIPAVNSQAGERNGYPTQKPVALLERVIAASSPPGGLVLDAFMGSGTTCEAAERLGRRWIGIDNGKYAIHLARKRLIQLHGQERPPEKPAYDYVECDHCGNIERKERKAREKIEPFQVQPFTVENMGVYQRAEKWQGFQTERSRYRDEMIKVFGGEPLAHSPLLHGKKGTQWVHVGPLDGPGVDLILSTAERSGPRLDRWAA